MKGWQPIQVSYKGQTGTIKPDRFLRLGASVENALTYMGYGQIALAFLSGKSENFKSFSVAEAYSLLLNAAGIEYDEHELFIRVSNSIDLQEVFQTLENFYSQLYPEPTKEEIEKAKASTPKKPKARKKKTSKS